jgi:5-methylcytosine-specific restriction enzyme A
VSNICILCRRIYYAAYKKKSRLTKVVQNTGEKICKDCQLKKSRKQFPIARTYKDGRDCRCNSCRKKKISTYKNSWISKRVGYANNSRTKTRRKKTMGTLTTILVLEKIKKQDYKCIYCGVVLTDKNLALDHNIPIFRGGANTIENIDCVCTDCNMLKFKKTSDEFKIFIKIYAERILSSQLEPKA